MDKIYPGDYLLLDDGRKVLVTDVPEGNEDAPEDLLVVSEISKPGTLFVVNPFQVDSLLTKR